MSRRKCTIKQRCQVFPFRTLSDGLAEARVGVADDELDPAPARAPRARRMKAGQAEPFVVARGQLEARGRGVYAVRGHPGGHEGGHGDDPARRRGP